MKCVVLSLSLFVPIAMGKPQEIAEFCGQILIINVVYKPITGGWECIQCSFGGKFSYCDFKVLYKKNIVCKQVTLAMQHLYTFVELENSFRVC